MDTTEEGVVEGPTNLFNISYITYLPEVDDVNTTEEGVVEGVEKPRREGNLFLSEHPVCVEINIGSHTRTTPARACDDPCNTNGREKEGCINLY